MNHTRANGALSSTQPKVSFLTDLRILFATVLTDPGSSLAYGVDSLIAVTAVAIALNYSQGVIVTVLAAMTIMFVYLLAVILYNRMTQIHSHTEMGGGSYVSAWLTAHAFRNSPRIKGLFDQVGRLGAGSMLADMPATQAISLIAGVEALYFIPSERRIAVAFLFLVVLSLVQRFGLGNLSRILIWPVLAFYTTNLIINLYGFTEILEHGIRPPQIHLGQDATHGVKIGFFLLLQAIANGTTIITGVEVGYSAVNVPSHGYKAVKTAMWILFGIVFCTYSLQIANFLCLGVTYDGSTPVPITIARHIGGDSFGVSIGILTALVLLLAAQTAQSDFPLQLMRLSRTDLFPRGFGDSGWKKVRSPLSERFRSHGGAYNPRAILFLGFVSIVILYNFPSSHAIEGMYGIAVLLAMSISVISFLVRLAHDKKLSFAPILGGAVFTAMLANIIYNKFFDGGWAIFAMLVVYFFLFAFAKAIYSIYREKQNVLPIEIAIWYPAFSNTQVDEKSALLVTGFHPGVIAFLKNYIRHGKMPLVLHFRTQESERLPAEFPNWFRSIEVSPDTDIVTAITTYVKDHQIQRVHLVPLLVAGRLPFKHYFFGNTIVALRNALSVVANVQEEYNRERVSITVKEVVHRAFALPN